MSRILAVDLDATLADVQQVYIRLAKERFNLDVKYDDIDNWDFWFQRIPKDDAWKIFEDIWVENSEEVRPTEDNLSSELYKVIGKGYEISIITSTQKACLPNAIHWLAAYGIPYKSITGLYNGQNKFDYPFSAIIDDNPGIAKKACLYPERQIFLKDQPWNRDVEEKCLKRVSTFGEMLQDLV